MPVDLLALAEDNEYGRLFIQGLNWSAPDHKPVTFAAEDSQPIVANNVSSYKGIRVWVCNGRPGSRIEAQVDRLLSKTSTDRLVIFHQGDQQIWRWPARRVQDGATTTRLTSHRHRSGVPDPKFVERLRSIQLPSDRGLSANELLARVRGAFDVEAQNETKQASNLMARMYAALESAYPGGNSAQTSHEISVTLARILFLMFGDDTDMWPADLFRDLVHSAAGSNALNLSRKLSALFAFLDTPPASRPHSAGEFEGFPYVNGEIFRERISLPNTSQDFQRAILDACAVDWSTISPAIFGSMFQSVRDSVTRRSLGEHYTSEENILRTLNPLFLDELRADLDRARSMKNESLALRRLWTRLGSIRYIDPACGCGNFIIVAYRELRAIEMQIMERLQELDGGTQLAVDPTLELKVALDHFHGIEIDEWPAKIAETAMFLVDRQCDLKLKERFGVAPERLPIQRQAKIVVGNALTLEWNSVCESSEDAIVAGNPPFLGHATRSDAQARELRNAWAREDISRLDYVTGWHAKALQYFGSKAGAWAFVTTNSITQGDPVPHLFGPIFDAGWRIKFAHRTFPWTSEAAGKAAVHCVIVGFTRDKASARLFEYAEDGERERSVRSINAYLVDGPNVFVEKRTAPISPGLPTATFGNMPRDDGNLIVSPEEYDEVMSDPIAAKYVRPFLGSSETLYAKKRWCLWLVDVSQGDLRRSPVLAERVSAVREFRLDSSAGSTRQMAATPHLFGQRPALHTKPYLVIPRVSTERRRYFIAKLVSPDVIASDATFTASDPSGLLFSVISSSMFDVWQRTVGGRLKSDLRFSNTIVWNNLPLPTVEVGLRQAIIAQGGAIQQIRDSDARSLAVQYDSVTMKPDLLAAHDRLDESVDLAFGAKSRCGTERERQRLLFSRYVELSR